jgi:hypothetical protein
MYLKDVHRVISGEDSPSQPYLRRSVIEVPKPEAELQQY